MTEQNDLQVIAMGQRSTFNFRSFRKGEMERQLSRVDLVQLIDFILCHGWQLCTVFCGTAYCLMRLLQFQQKFFYLCDVVFTLSINIIVRTSAISWPDLKGLIFFQLPYSFYCQDFSFSRIWRKATLL